MRKAYPWYVTRLGPSRAGVKALQEQLQRAGTLEEVDAMLDGCLAGEADLDAAMIA